MITLSGKSACGGIVIGRLSFYRRDEGEIKKKSISDVKKELLRYDAAVKKAKEQLSHL